MQLNFLGGRENRKNFNTNLYLTFVYSAKLVILCGGRVNTLSPFSKRMFQYPNLFKRCQIFCVTIPRSFVRLVTVELAKGSKIHMSLFDLMI